MFHQIKSQLTPAIATTSHSLFVNTKNTLGTLPNTFYEIKNLPNVRFLLSNSVLINCIQFVLPFATYSFLKLLLKTQIETSYPEYSENKYAIFAANVLEKTAYAVIFTRFKFKNIVFNTTANLGATRVLHEEFSDDEPHPLCINCKKEKNHLVNEISLIVHYLIGGLTISVAEFAISYTPYVGATAAFVLDAYWRGFGIFQYPLTRENICAEHKMAILMQDRIRLIVFGLLYASVELLLVDTANSRASGFISERVILTTISNILALFSLIHAHNMAIEIPSRHELLPSNIPFDPVTVAWSLSISGTQMCSQYILALAQKNKNNELPYIEKMQAMWFSLSQKPALYIPVTFIIDLFIVTELKSLKEFSRARALRPYMISFLEDADAILKTANEYNDHPIAQLVHYSLKIPFIKTRITTWGANIAKDKIGIEPVFTKALVKLIQIVNLNENLGEIQKKVEEVYQKSLASHHKNSWHKLLGFGSNTPQCWFTYNRDFVKVKRRAQETSSAHLTTTGIMTNLMLANPQPVKRGKGVTADNFDKTKARPQQNVTPVNISPKIKETLDDEYCILSTSPSNFSTHKASPRH